MKSSNVKDDNYFTIQGWMITELGLKGNDLIVYAIIYGFSQTNGQRFTGSLQYLADWCKGTKSGIQKNLKSLVQSGLLIKYENEKNGVKFCEYEAIRPSCMVYNSVAYPIQLSCTNNIDNNIVNTDNTNVLSSGDTANDEEFLKTTSLIEKPQPKAKKSNLYSNCMVLIDEFTEDNEVRDLLKEFLSVRLENKSKPFGKASFNGMLKKLRTLTESKSECLKIIQQAIDRQYLTFYPLVKAKTKPTCPELIESSEKITISKSEYKEAIGIGTKF